MRTELVCLISTCGAAAIMSAAFGFSRIYRKKTEPVPIRCEEMSDTRPELFIEYEYHRDNGFIKLTGHRMEGRPSGPAGALGPEHERVAVNPSGPPAGPVIGDEMPVGASTERA
jgi:hypothetical protein